MEFCLNAAMISGVEQVDHSASQGDSASPGCLSTITAPAKRGFDKVNRQLTFRENAMLDTARRRAQSIICLTPNLSVISASADGRVVHWTRHGSAEAEVKVRSAALNDELNSICALNVWPIADAGVTFRSGVDGRLITGEIRRDVRPLWACCFVHQGKVEIWNMKETNRVRDMCCCTMHPHSTRRGRRTQPQQTDASRTL